MADDDRQVPVWFCTGCGNCCRWPGDVKLTPVDIVHISRHLGISHDDFIDRYTRLQSDRRGLSLTDQENGACVFLDCEHERCTINDVKPQQCRDFPNRWHHAGFESECAAIKLRTHIRRARAAERTPPPAYRDDA